MKTAFFTIGEEAKDANDYLFYDKKGVLHYDTDGSGAKAAIAVATIKKTGKISFHEFLIT